jgi:hypothetical protein
LLWLYHDAPDLVLYYDLQGLYHAAPGVFPYYQMFKY